MRIFSPSNSAFAHLATSSPASTPDQRIFLTDDTFPRLFNFQEICLLRFDPHSSSKLFVSPTYATQIADMDGPCSPTESLGLKESLQKSLRSLTPIVARTSLISVGFQAEIFRKVFGLQHHYSSWRAPCPQSNNLSAIEAVRYSLFASRVQGKSSLTFRRCF